MDSNSDAILDEILAKVREKYESLSAEELKELTEEAKKDMTMYSKVFNPLTDSADIAVQLEKSLNTQSQIYELKQEAKEAKEELAQVKKDKKSVEEALAKKYEAQPEMLFNIHQELTTQSDKDLIKSLKEEVKDLTAMFALVARDLDLEKKKVGEKDEEIKQLMRENGTLRAKATLHRHAHLESEKALISADVKFQNSLNVIGRQEMELEDLRRVRDQLEDQDTPDAKKLLNLTHYFHESRKKMIRMNLDLNNAKERLQNFEDAFERMDKEQKDKEKEHLEEVNELQMILEKQDDELEKLKMELETLNSGGDSGDSDGWRPLDDSDGEVLRD